MFAVHIYTCFLQMPLMSNHFECENQTAELLVFQLTWADIHLVNFLTWPQTMDLDVDMTAYPKLAALNERVTSLPNIAN